MASISITYTPNYEGCHRIYFKAATADDYCMYLDSSLSVIGEPKTTVIELTGTLDNCLVPDIVSCADFAVDGYVQPCCSSEADLDTRAPFSFDALTNKCNTYNVECLAAGISKITISNAGSGYVTAPTVTIVGGGGGSGFAYTVVMDAGAVDEVIVSSNGENYDPAATVVFSASPTGGTATGYIEFCPCGILCGSTSAVYYNNCIDQTQERVDTPYGGSSYKVCSETLPIATAAPKTNISKVTDTTCCACTSYNIVNGEKARVLNITYIDCNNVLQETSIPALNNTTVCAITGSIHIVQDYVHTITSLGSCS
jgi:hypothetical protein